RQPRPRGGRVRGGRARVGAWVIPGAHLRRGRRPRRRAETRPRPVPESSLFPHPSRILRREAALGAPRTSCSTKTRVYGPRGEPAWPRTLFLARLLACGDLAAPAVGLRAAALDQFLEALEIAADATRVEARGRAERLRGTFRLVAHRQAHQRPRVASRLEGDGAARLLAVLADPADLPVRMLLQYLGVPLRRLAGDRRHPVQAGVVQLLHVVDAFHEE